MSENPTGRGPSVDLGSGIEVDGQTFYPLTRHIDELNPCAGKDDGTSCGPGCVCRGGQCYYTLQRLREMGIPIPND